MDSSGALGTIGLHLGLFGGAAILCNGLFPRWKTLDRVLATATFGFSFLVIGLEALGVLERLTFPFAAAFSGLVFAVGLSVGIAARRPRSSPREHARTTPGPARAACLLALFVAAWAVEAWVQHGLLRPVEPNSDAPIYHLPIAIQWWQAGRLEYVPTPFGELAASYFPANGELWFTWLFLGTGSELPAKVGQFPFLLVGAAAVYGIARQLGGDVAAALIAAAVWSGSLLTCAFVGVANVDLIFAAAYLVSCHFLFRLLAGERPEHPVTACAALSGLAAGIALGTKSIGLVFVPLLVLPLAWCSWRRRLGPWSAVAWILAAAATGSFWYARNWIWTGNPIYPLDVSLAGIRLFPGWYTSDVMRTSGYHVPIQEWRFFVDRLTALGDLRILAALAVGCVVVVGTTLGRRFRDPRDRAATLSIGIALAQVALYWFVVPYNTQERFLIAALGLLAAPAARALSGRPWLALAAAAGFAFCAVTPSWSTNLSPLAPPHSHTLVRALERPNVDSAVFAAMLLAAAGLLWKPTPWRVAAACLVAALPLLLSVDAGGAGREPFRGVRSPYPRTGVGRQMSGVWEELEHQRGDRAVRVAYAGTNLPYYLFGRSLDNRVHYVHVRGPAKRPLHEMHFEEEGARTTSNPFPQWYRERPDYDEWLRNLRELRIDYLFVARENLHGQRGRTETLAPFPIEDHWARSHPEVFERIEPRREAPPGPAWAALYRLRPAKESKATSESPSRTRNAPAPGPPGR